MLKTNDKLHNARIEFVISLKESTWDHIRLDFTEHAVANLLSDMCLSLFGSEIPILYRLPAESLTEFLRQEIHGLLMPIKYVTDAFFQNQKPVTPDELETVHLCELILSFILYGTKNYLPNLRNIGLTMDRFKTVNRITLAYAHFRRQGHNFLLDGSRNSSGRVYTIDYPIGPNTKDCDELTRQLLQIHEHVSKLDMFSVAITVLYFLMREICKYGSDFIRDLRRSDPKRVFSRSLLNTRGFRMRDTPVTIQQFIAGLMSVQHSSENCIFGILETAAEVLSDLYDQDGHTLLAEGLDNVLHCCFKGRIPLDIYCAPSVRDNTLTMSTWCCIIPDTNQILLDENPPIFHPQLLRRIFIIANRLMADLKPFPDGIAEIPNWAVALLYILVRNKCQDQIRTIRRLGWAMALKYSDERQHKKLLDYASNNGLDMADMVRLGILVQVSQERFTVHEDHSFSYRVYDFLTATQQQCMIVYGRLNSVGLNALS